MVQVQVSTIVLAPFQCSCSCGRYLYFLLFGNPAVIPFASSNIVVLFGAYKVYLFTVALAVSECSFYVIFQLFNPFVEENQQPSPTSKTMNKFYFLFYSLSLPTLVIVLLLVLKTNKWLKNSTFINIL